MATLNEMKKRLKEAANLERIDIIKGDKNQVLIDLNGDGEPEAALIDTTDKFFKSPQEAKLLMLGGSTLLFGRK